MREKERDCVSVGGRKRKRVLFNPDSSLLKLEKLIAGGATDATDNCTGTGAKGI